MNQESKSTVAKNIFLFVIMPTALNLLLMGFYFSGVDTLQQIISPNNGVLTRESGLLEQLQNLYLISIFLMFLFFAVKRQDKKEKIFFLFFSAIFLFLFLEEVDYGVSLYELITGNDMSGSVRNWHNESITGGRQNVHYLKKLNNLAILLWFIIFPLFASKIKIPVIKSLIPQKLFIVGFIFTAICSPIAHSLDDLGYSVINGVSGSLIGNISEFREHNTYYFFLLYAIQIVKAKLIFNIKVSDKSIE